LAHASQRSRVQKKLNKTSGLKLKSAPQAITSGWTNYVKRNKVKMEVIHSRTNKSLVNKLLRQQFPVQNAKKFMIQGLYNIYN